jgi:hypothetical protein
MFRATQGLVSAMVMPWVFDYAVDIDTCRSFTGLSLTLLESAFCQLVKPLAANCCRVRCRSRVHGCCVCVKEALLLKKHFNAFGRDVAPVHMFCDNMAAIKLIKHRIASMWSTHTINRNNGVQRLSRIRCLFYTVLTRQYIWLATIICAKQSSQTRQHR